MQFDQQGPPKLSADCQQGEEPLNSHCYNLVIKLLFVQITRLKKSQSIIGLIWSENGL